jgi:hypothetical protein
MPSAIPAGSKSRRTILKNVIMPNTKVDYLVGATDYQSDQFGGFRAQFVRRAGGEEGAESLTTMPPAENSKTAQFADNTPLIEVELKLLTSETTRPSFYAIKFRVHPRY